MGVTVRVTKVRAGARTPEYMSHGAAGCDVTACVDAPVVVLPGKRAAIPTGLAFEINDGFEIQVRPRSGMAFKKGLTVVNAPGTIDADYRGEVMVLVINLGEEPVTIAAGDRIAQLVLQKVERICWVEAETLNETARGVGGFGSTGVESRPTGE